MDIEKELRKTLREKLDTDFETAEEVSLLTANGLNVRADVIAFPRSPDFSQKILAFEVKTATDRNFQKWTKVFRQAYDYVGSTIKNGKMKGMVVRASFVFPSPPYDFLSETIENSTYWRNTEGKQLAGVIHMASTLKVGTAFQRHQNPGKGFYLTMGPNTIWNSRRGWFADGQRLLSSNRVGSRNVRTES